MPYDLYGTTIWKIDKSYHIGFTRVVFGSGPSPYILGATIQKHVAQYAEVFPQTVEDLQRDTYVDDVQSGGEDAEELQWFKREATQIMAEGGFQLHKWHSKHPRLSGFSRMAASLDFILLN